MANLPHIPDRSRAILEQGANPLAAMFEGIDLLVNAGCGVIAVPCNTSHHWHPDFVKYSPIPVLHIAKVCVAAVSSRGRTAILCTLGCLHSGFYQRIIKAHGDICHVPDPYNLQPRIDSCIAAVKRGDLAGGSFQLEPVLRMLAAEGVKTVLLGCTELPMAVLGCDPCSHQGMTLVDSTLELARASVRYGIDRGWNIPCQQIL